jgi:hypothetical protein
MADFSFTTYYDFRWTFVFNVAVWLSKVRETTGQSVEVDSTMVQVGEVKRPQPPWPHGVIQGRPR